MVVKDLVIVESPAKAKTIGKILGSKFLVEASYGHIRDLPKSKLGVEVESDFSPQYVIPTKNRKQVTKLKKLADKSGIVYLATDEDREGEAIGWHVKQVLKLPEERVKRVAFHEITPEAIKAAFEHTRDIDINLVDAQQARRVLDRLVGYKLSPLLWKKIFRRLSAGRVQSVALRLIVDREREIEKFNPEEYWSVDLNFQTGTGEKFIAQIFAQNGAELTIKNQAEADALVKEVQEASEHKVVKALHDERKRNAPAPFTTSTLQQAASTQLGFSVKKTMLVAQQLYEGIDIDGKGPVGLITYMRTDSTSLAVSAVEAARSYVKEHFGPEYLPDKPMIYKAKSRNAQEAHEAIRPTRVELAPSEVSSVLAPDQLKLYKLIWQRTLACQMMPAVISTQEVVVQSASVQSKATGAVVKFPGFAKVFDKWPFKENQLPEIHENDLLDLKDIEPLQHFTEPPARYTEAALVKKMEQMGIGRPSTYAPTITTIETRGYIQKDKRALVPQEVGLMVNDFLVEHFPDIVDYDFTAKMEDSLDEIAEGHRKWQPMIKDFYEPFIKQIELKDEEVKKQTGEDKLTDKLCPKCGSPLMIKTGRFGQFLACSTFPECRHTEALNPETSEPETEEKTCSLCGGKMVKKHGRFGPFWGCSNYPECKNIENIGGPASNVSVKCPKCKEGMLVAKRTKRGKVFWGCNTYPTCDFASWDEPVETPCPTCGGFMTKPAKKGYPVCTKCGYEEKSPAVGA